MQISRASYRLHGGALLSYGVIALFFNWPLPLDLGGSLTGPVGGDTGVYLWNTWLFRHELLAHGRFPLFTQEILSLTPPVDLSLHNYTLFADLLAFPLIPFLGVTATFNVIYLGISILTAWSMFVLARSVVGRTGEAWLAGLLFGFSPVLIARGTAHFSLASAAPLPIFLFLLRRAERDGHPRHAAAAGVAVAWASICDPYYGVFCIVIALSYFAARRVRVDFGRPRPPLGGGYTRVVDALLILVIAVIAIIIISGGTDIHLLRYRIAMRTLYTPVLLLTILGIARAWLWLRPTFGPRLPPPRLVLRFVGIAGAVCAALLSPILFALWHNLADGGVLHGQTFWRSSPAGVDLLALFAPNPNHALFGGPWREWLTSRPNGYADNVASLTLVGVAVIATAVWRDRFRPPRVWVGLTMFFALLSLGPFVSVGGTNTFVPGPWALLRYLPIITATRMPSRYAVPLMMLFSLLFALALARITAHRPARRRAVLTAVGLALVFELSPFPRPLYSAHVPDVYRTIANDPRDVRVLNLPFGFRDGEWSQGNFSAASQFYQTVHEKRLIGGYLSRIGPREMQRQRQSVTVRRLIRLSEGQQLSLQDLEEVKRRAPGFVDRTRLAYVVIDVSQTPPALRNFAIEAYGLVKLGESDGRELYVPTVGTVTAKLR
jgi:hypothetical protein